MNIDQITNILINDITELVHVLDEGNHKETNVKNLSAMNLLIFLVMQSTNLMKAKIWCVR